MMQTPLTDKEYLLQKFEGKGGWTFAEIPEIPLDKNNPFGFVKVRGSIDSYTFSNYRLMPLGNGRLMIAVKADIRKKIGKQAGDVVRIILYADDEPVDIPAELVLCLKDEPEAWGNFSGFSDGVKKAFIDWIESAKTDETRISRMAKTVDMAAKGQKMTFK